MSTAFDVLGIGNAIVDIIARTEEDFLAKHGMNKGSMALIDEPRAEAIYNAMGPVTESSGGSAANTIAGVASFGGRAAFVGKVKGDKLGEAFSHDIRAVGVAFTTPPASEGAATARCFVLVTPDGERTMNTYLGAAQDLHPRDLDEEQIASAAITYLEGYLWDPKNAKEAFRQAATIAHAAGRKVALTLSDSFCVGRYRAEFLDLINDEDRRSRVRQRVRIARALRDVGFRHRADAVAQGCRARRRHAQREGLRRGIQRRSCCRAGFPVDKLVDTTGAGDLFAAGFLFGLARGASYRSCGELGALAANEVIQHLGARPETSLKSLAASRGIRVPA